MNYHKLRIAWSVGCGIACLLLIVFWLRSFGSDELFRCAVSKHIFCIESRLGEVSLSTTVNNGRQGVWWQVRSDPVRTEPPKFSWNDPLGTGIDALIEIVEPGLETDKPLNQESWGFGFISDPANSFYDVGMPHWFPIILLGTVAALPWLRWSKRFSLRTLLIAMTLVAVGLGVVIALSR